MDLIYVVVGIAVLVVLAGAYLLLPPLRMPQSRSKPSTLSSRSRGGPPGSGRHRWPLGQVPDGPRVAPFGGSLDVAPSTPQFWEAMEEALIGADVGVAASAGVVERVRQAKPETSASARKLLEEELKAVFAHAERGLNLEGTPAVMLIVGVNGSGKTTSIAKLASRLIGRRSPAAPGRGRHVSGRRRQPAAGLG